MKLKLVTKDENAFLNPDFVKEKTLKLEFEGNRIFAPFETDIVSATVFAAKYAFVGAAVHAFASGNSAMGFMLLAVPAVDVFNRATKISRGSTPDVSQGSEYKP